MSLTRSARSILPARARRARSAPCSTSDGLTYRLGERLLIDSASAALPSGSRVGLVGRNGAGKTTLFRLIRGELSPESGAVIAPKGARIGSVEQEAPGGAESLIDFVLAADVEREALNAEAEIASDPERIAEIQNSPRRHRRAYGAGAGGANPQRAGLRRAGAAPAAF